MIELICPYSLSGVPSIINSVLDSYAEELLRASLPEVLLKPTPVNVEVFLEYYLKLSIEYKRLSYDKKVLGMTAFNKGYVQIINEITGKPDAIYVDEGTVIADVSLLGKRNEHRLRFTLMHEGAHWLIHKKAFSSENPFFTNNRYENQYLAAKEGRIDYSRCQTERTDSERIERQADYLSSVLLMPRTTLRMAYRDYFKYFDMRPIQIVRGSCPEHDLYAEQLPEYLSKLYNVSKRAALIRLEKLNAITDRITWGRR